MENAILVRPGVPVPVVYFLRRPARERQSSSMQAPQAAQPTIARIPAAARPPGGDWKFFKLDRVSRA